MTSANGSKLKAHTKKNERLGAGKLSPVNDGGLGEIRNLSDFSAITTFTNHQRVDNES
jgi:hypothetical protein